jgi:hypothetical protein
MFSDNNPIPPEMKQEILCLITSASILGTFIDSAFFLPTLIKTRQMTQGAVGVKQSMPEILTSVTQKWGLPGLYRGLGVVLLTAIPANVLYFSTVNLLPKVVEHNGLDQYRYLPTSYLTGWAAQAAGSVGWVPGEVIREMMQTHYPKGVNVKISPELSLGKTIKKIVATNGIRGFYSGAVAQFVAYGPFNSIGIAWSIMARQWLFDGKKGLKEDLISYGTGFTGASIATNPLDVIKTRMQVRKQAADIYRYTTMWGCARHIIQHEGFSTFFKGAFARVASLAGKTTFMFTTVGLGVSELKRRGVFAPPIREKPEDKPSASW